MKAFLALLGATLGLYLSHRLDAPSLAVTAFFALGLIGVLAKKRTLLPFLLPLLIGILVGVLTLYLPLPEEGTFKGIVVRQRDNYVLLQTLRGRFYVAAKDNTYELGDGLSVTGKLKEPAFAHYESRFDFGRYLSDMGVRKEITGARCDVIWSNPIRLREKEVAWLSSLPENARGYFDALLFAHKDYSNPFIEAAGEANLLYALSASGFLYSFYLRLVEKAVGHFAPNAAKPVALCFGLFFLPFGLAKVGILRAFAMRVFRLADEAKKKDTNYTGTLGRSGLLLVLLDYHVVFEVGFLLGYAIAFTLYVAKWASDRKGKLLEKAKGLLLIRVLLLPLSLSNGKIHVFSFLITLILLPISALAMGMGYLSFLTVPLPRSLESVAKAAEAVVGWGQMIDFAIPLPMMGVVGIALFYVLVVASLILSELRLKGLRAGLIGTSLALYVLSLAPVVPLVSESVSFIDVGQGDCTLIQRGLTAVMVDTGGQKSFDMAEESLIPYLRKRRIYQLDALIVTHDDFDHDGAVSTLCALFPVKQVVDQPKQFPLSFGQLVINNLNDYGAKEGNDASLVVTFSLLGKDFLLMGDAPKWVEERIIDDHPDLRCDVLKAGHHGSNTSTGASFLKTVRPKEAVISCGEGNRYGHPHADVLESLRAFGVTVRRTDEEGTITYAGVRRV